MAEGFLSKIFTEDFRSKPIAKYAAIGVVIFFVLIIGLKLTAKSSPGIDTAGFYILYIPLWLIFSIAILQLLSQIANMLRVGVVILFFVGLFMIFVADSPVEGIMALGPVGIVIIAILNFIITTLAISLVPGILAGLAVGALMGGGSSLAVILADPLCHWFFHQFAGGQNCGCHGWGFVFLLPAGNPRHIHFYVTYIRS